MEGRVHHQVAELLSAYIDGEVSASQRALIERHLVACPTCTRDLAALRHTVQLLGQLPVVAPPRAFTLRESQVRPHRPPMWRWLLGAPALAGGLVTLLCIVAIGGVVLVSRLSPGSAELPLALAPAPTRTALTLPLPQVVTVVPTAPAGVETRPAFQSVLPTDTATLPAAVASPTEMAPSVADEFSAAANQPPTETVPSGGPTPTFRPAETGGVPPATPTPPTEVIAPPTIAEGTAPTEAVDAVREEAGPTTEAALPMAVMPATAPTDQPATEFAVKTATTEPTVAAARDVGASAESVVTNTPRPPATPTPAPVATDTPRPSATHTAALTATDTPEPAPEDVASSAEVEMREATAEAAQAGREVTAPEEPAFTPPPAEAPKAGEVAETSTPLAGVDEPAAAPSAELTPTPVPMEIEELQLSVKPGVIRISGRLPLPEGQRLQAELWRADERLAWSVSQPKDGPVAVQAEGRFELVLRAEPDTPDDDLFALPPAEYEVRIVPIEPPAALEARVPFDTFPPSTPAPK